MWICDTCGKGINSVDEAWLEWVTCEKEQEKFRNKGFNPVRIVHQVKASPRGSCYSVASCGGHLCQYVGNDGLINLLELISIGNIPMEEGFEVIKRIFIPGYEQARSYFAEAINAGVFEPNTKEGYYNTREIEATLEYIKNK